MSSSDDDDEFLAAPEEASAAEIPRWRYLLHIAYFGSNLVGWQRQLYKNANGDSSVQELVEDAVTAVLAAAQRVNVSSCSRTDAGTHALYQYATIKSEKELLDMTEFQHQVNTLLPEGIRVLEVTTVNPAAKPSRFRSKYKKYVYYIQQGHRPNLELGKFSWFLGKRVNVERLREALQHLVGPHDFRPFSQGLQKAEFANRSTVRTIISAKVKVKRNVVFSLDPTSCGCGEELEGTDALYALEPHVVTTPDYSITDENGSTKKRKINDVGAPTHFICIELIANGFLRHMVRRIVGTSRQIAEGTLPPSHMKDVLDGRQEPGISAPAKGLWLHRTWLSQEDWDNDTTKGD